MTALRPSSGAFRRALSTRHSRLQVAMVLIAVLWGLWPADLLAAEIDPRRASTSSDARDSAIQAIPIEKLDADARKKVSSVLSSISVFRRMPVGVVACDPNLYLFMVQHPDVVVNIWEELELSRMQFRSTGENTYRVTDAAGTKATVEILYRSHDTHIAYAEGSYDGPLTLQPVKGSCLMVLKTGYIQEPDGRYYITSRLDTFLRIDSAGVELLAKTVQPFVGSVADNNFLQTIAFLGSLSRTAEVNTDGVQRLASALSHVEPQLRDRLAELAAEIAHKAAESQAKTAAPSPQVAARNDPQPTR